ncbi:hypothetical protein HU200_054080 [Digitaria exilis]|uniref:Uncharacterized protein n=1 Tax=Digitaria exilis TaxID=1010633 RepID=A0A835AQV9_9POAL|nr:hypothetical protein HU200_054080 [Digitaria exilis]
MERILERKNPWMPEMKQWMRPSIYRVPEWLNSMTKREAYQPQVVSLGPFHHGERNLKPMEEHKHRLMLHMVKRSGKPLAQFIAAIKKVAERLQEAYDGLDEKWCGENTDRFVDVMVTDGAFLLEMMTCTSTGQVPSDYAPYDPIFSDHSILSLWAYIQSDMILVENQVPLLALQTLEAVRNNGTSPGNTYINKMVGNFVCPKLSKGNLPTEIIDVLGLHPLDVFHKCFCALSHTWSPDLKRSGQRETLMLSAAELREAGVHFKKSKTQSFRDIEFNKGVLSMPLVEIGDTSERMFLNLMAFERLHCSAGNDVTAYIIFMDNIIDSERDVALLKSKGVLKNFLSSDKAAAELFNSLGNGITLDPNSKICHVQWKVDMHCKKPWPKLQASFKHTYMRNPWVFISGVAAVILLSLTILQTIYTIMPFYKKN